MVPNPEEKSGSFGGLHCRDPGGPWQDHVSRVIALYIHINPPAQSFLYIYIHCGLAIDRSY